MLLVPVQMVKAPVPLIFVPRYLCFKHPTVYTPVEVAIRA